MDSQREFFKLLIADISMPEFIRWTDVMCSPEYIIDSRTRYFGSRSVFAIRHTFRVVRELLTRCFLSNNTSALPLFLHLSLNSDIRMINVLVFDDHFRFRDASKASI